MSILITGGAGFIGSNLITFLNNKSKKNIVCVDSMALGKKENILNSLSLQKNKVFIYKFNINNKKKLEEIFIKHKVSEIYHLAANSDISKSMLDFTVDLKNTFLTTINLLNLANKYKVKFFFFASSSAIYGEVKYRLKETDGNLNPISFYGSAKLASEAYISSYAHSFNLKTLIFRFPNVVGPNLTHGVIFDFINKLKKNKNLLSVLGNGEQNKPYLHVSDLINAIHIATNEFKHNSKFLDIYNVAGKGVTTVKEIAKLVVKKFGSDNTKIIFEESEYGWVGDVKSFKYNIKKIKLLGWKPKMSSIQAIRKCINEQR